MSSPAAYHYRIPTNGWRPIAGAIISFGMVCFVGFAMTQKPGDIGLYFCAAIAIGFFLFSAASTIVGILRPSATELHVDEQDFYWRTPWPFAGEHTIPLASIVRVTAWTGGRGSDRFALRLDNGTVYKLPAACFGKDCSKLLKALQTVAPHIEIHRRMNNWPDWRGPA